MFAKKLPNGLTDKVCKLSGTEPRTVRKLWNQYVKAKSKAQAKGDDVTTPDVFQPKKRTGRPRKQLSLSPLQNGGVRYRSYRELAAIMSEQSGVKVSESLIRRRKQSGDLQVCKVRRKIYLDSDAMQSRVKFILELIADEGRFPPFDDVIFIDEKWFYPHVKNLNIAYAGNEENVRRVQHVNRGHSESIKSMFIAAVAKPRTWVSSFGLQENEFDGKLVCHPCVEETVAKRKSKNRDRGDKVVKPVSVTGRTLLAFFDQVLFPSVVQKWPTTWPKSRPIYIWLDNARPHCALEKSLKTEWEQVHGRWLENTSYDFRLRFQPKLSPDLNILDLSLFRSLDRARPSPSLVKMNTIEEVMETVLTAWKDWDPDCLARAFRTLQDVMVKILEHKGGNTFKLPHSRKTPSGHLNYGEAIIDDALIREALAYMNGFNCVSRADQDDRQDSDTDEDENDDESTSLGCILGVQDTCLNYNCRQDPPVSYQTTPMRGLQWLNRLL
eukprot:Clim_evm11s199 gene=Clim_evmTU11s199